MLTADAFGVLPPISLLTPEQAMYHFLSGYTAQVAGTERGVTEPQATFSTCFGAPFMPRRPSVYAELLGELMRRHQRALLADQHRLDRRRPTASASACRWRRPGPCSTPPSTGGSTDGEMRLHPVFGLRMPTSCPEVDPHLLDPRGTWADCSDYDDKAREVAGRFASNFEQFHGTVDRGVVAAGIGPS